MKKTIGNIAILTSNIIFNVQLACKDGLICDMVTHCPNFSFLWNWASLMWSWRVGLGFCWCVSLKSLSDPKPQLFEVVKRGWECGSAKKGSEVLGRESECENGRMEGTEIRRRSSRSSFAFCYWEVICFGAVPYFPYESTTPHQFGSGRVEFQTAGRPGKRANNLKTRPKPLI